MPSFHSEGASAPADVANVDASLTSSLHDINGSIAAYVGNISIGTVTAGVDASVTNSGTPNDAVLNFVLPKGDKGDTGSLLAVGDYGDVAVATGGALQVQSAQAGFNVAGNALVTGNFTADGKITATPVSGISLEAFNNGNTVQGVGVDLNSLGFELSFFSGWADPTTGKTDGKFTFNGRRSDTGELTEFAKITNAGTSIDKGYLDVTESLGFLQPTASARIQWNSDSGASLSGVGTTYDVGIRNAAGTSVMLVPHNSGDVTFTGGISVAGNATFNHPIQVNSTSLTLDTTGSNYIKVGDSVHGYVYLRSEDNTQPEIHVRPNSGQRGVISFTEDAVADRWSMGIMPGDGHFYWAPGGLTLTSPVMNLSSTGALTINDTLVTQGTTAGVNFGQRTTGNNFVAYADAGKWNLYSNGGVRFSVSDTGDVVSTSITCSSVIEVDGSGPSFILNAPSGQDCRVDFRQNGTALGSFGVNADASGINLTAQFGKVIDFTAAGFTAARVDYTNGLTVCPRTSITPTTNGDMVFELTSDTTLTVKVKGSDGVVRSTALTLA